MSVAGRPAGHIINNKEKEISSDLYLCSLLEPHRTNKAFRATSHRIKNLNSLYFVGLKNVFVYYFSSLLMYY